jgi:hypothetical protein
VGVEPIDWDQLAQLGEQEKNRIQEKIELGVLDKISKVTREFTADSPVRDPVAPLMGLRTEPHRPSPVRPARKEDIRLPGRELLLYHGVKVF